jgi:hypothetical protein
LPTPVYSTNVVTVNVTNVTGQIVPINVTNILTAWQTNQAAILLTNVVPQYSYGPGQGSGVMSGLAGLFGYGTPAALLLSLGANLFQRKRNGALGATAANTAQAIETAREFIKSLPNGGAYDTAFVNWLQLHQSEAGVTKQIVDLIDSQVSNSDARVAADSIRQTLDVLFRGQPQPTAPAKVGI